MNLAFPALLILLFVLPGILSRYAYTRGFFRWRSIIQVRPWTEEILPSLTLAILLQFAWYKIWEQVHGTPNLTSALILLTGTYGPSNKFFADTIAAVSQHPGEISLYLLLLFIVSLSVGWLGRAVVLGCGLDLKYEVFRFSNLWHYLLTGEVFLFKELSLRKTLHDWFCEVFLDRNPKAHQHTERENSAHFIKRLRWPRPAPNEIDGVYLSAVVDQGGEAYIYRGIVRDFWFDSRSGDLDGIQLMLADRRHLRSGDRTDSATESKRYYSIRGDYFVLRYSDTRNINLLYFTFVPTDGLTEVRL